MFNNPLRKYQIGGNISEDQAMQQVVEFISQVAKVSPEEVVTKLDQIKGDENAVKLLSEALELAKNNDERGFQAIQQIFNPQVTGKFAKGGKLHDFICKHAKGGYIAGCGCGNVQKGEIGISSIGDNRNYTVEVNAPGDTTRTKQYNYRQEIMQTYPDGSVRYTTRTTSGEPTEIHTWGPEGRPSFLRRLWFGNRQANPETVTNWRNIIANHPEDPRNVESERDGGKFQEKNQKATFVNFSYPEHNYPPEEAEAYQSQATEAALDATGANDGNGIVLVTVNNEQPMTTPTVFSIPSRNNAPIIGNLDKNSDKLNTLALLNLWKNEQNEEETQNRSDLVYRPFRSSIVDYLKSEGIIKAQKGGPMSKREALDKAMITHNYSDRATARFAYANAKNALRKEGYRGRALREQARRMIAGDTTGFKSEETNSVQNGVNSKEVKSIDNENLNLQNLIMANLIAQEPISVNNEIVELPDMKEIPIPNFTVERGKYKETNTPENTNENLEQNVRDAWLRHRIKMSEESLNNNEPILPTIEDVIIKEPEIQVPIFPRLDDNYTVATVENKSNKNADNRYSASGLTFYFPKSNETTVNTELETNNQPNGSWTEHRLPGTFTSNVEQAPSNFNLSGTSNSDSYGARQTIINNQVKRYLDNTATSGLAEFRDGRWVWSKSGIPVEVPMIRKRGSGWFSREFVPVVQKQGGILKGQNAIPGGIPAENKIYSEKNTRVTGPSIGQRGLGVRRPWLAQTVSFNPFSAQNDTTYTGRGLESFIPGYSDDILKIRYSVLPSAVKKNLAKVIDSDYEEYNNTRGSYPNNYYEKTITVNKRK